MIYPKRMACMDWGDELATSPSVKLIVKDVRQLVKENLAPKCQRSWQISLDMFKISSCRQLKSSCFWMEGHPRRRWCQDVQGRLLQAKRETEQKVAAELTLGSQQKAAVVIQGLDNLMIFFGGWFSPQKYRVKASCKILPDISGTNMRPGSFYTVQCMRWINDTGPSRLGFGGVFSRRKTCCFQMTASENKTT